MNFFSSFQITCFSLNLNLGDKNPHEPPYQLTNKNQDSYFEELLKKPKHHKASQNLHPNHSNKKPPHHAAKDKPAPHPIETQVPHETVGPENENKPDKSDHLENTSKSPAQDALGNSTGVERSTVKDNNLEILNGSKPEVHSENKSSLNNLENAVKENKQLPTDESKQNTAEKKTETKTGMIFNLNFFKEYFSYRSTVAQMAARSPHDRKVGGSNPAGSYETCF